MRWLSPWAVAVLALAVGFALVLLLRIPVTAVTARVLIFGTLAVLVARRRKR